MLLHNECEVEKFTDVHVDETSLSFPGPISAGLLAQVFWSQKLPSSALILLAHNEILFLIIFIDVVIHQSGNK